MIGGNGSYVEYNEEVIMHQMISKRRLRAIVDWLHERGLEFYLESNNGLFASENFKEAACPVMRRYVMQKGKTAAEVEHMEAEDALHGLVYGGELYRDDLNKVSFILNSYQDHLDSAKAFPNLKKLALGVVEGKQLYLATSALKTLPKRIHRRYFRAFAG